MLEKGSKQQRDMTKRTQKLRKDITKLVNEYERETGVEVTSAHFITTDRYDVTTSQVVVEIRVPDFKDLSDSDV